MTEQIPLFKVFMNPDINITPTLLSGQITQGKQNEKFEQELTHWFNHPYILTLNSATSGLTLAIRMLDLPLGSEILSTPLSCLATNEPILANHHCIKWVDVDPNTCNMDLNDLESKITELTRAIVFVHWGGYPLDLDRLREIQARAESKYGRPIPIIEDCAHAFGSMYKGKNIGTHGNICVFSLQAIKHLTTGDGGLIFLPNKEMYERAKLLRWYGISREGKVNSKDFRLETDVAEWGYKFHMNDINASIGLSNLPFIRGNLDIMRDNYNYYRTNLKDIPGVQLLEQKEGHQSACWLFTFKIIGKQDFIPYMKTNGVMVSQVHNRNDLHSCMKKFQCPLPVLDQLEKEIICIPVGWWITPQQRERIVELIRYYTDGLSEKLPLDKLIRPLLPSDYEKGYLDLLAQMNGYKEEYTQEKFTQKYNQVIAQGSLIAVIEYKGRIIATGKLLIEQKFYSSHGHIEDIVVDEYYRRYGLASKIIQYLISKSKGCYKISLGSKPGVENLYIKNGFSAVGNHFAKY